MIYLILIICFLQFLLLRDLFRVSKFKVILINITFFCFFSLYVIPLILNQRYRSLSDIIFLGSLGLFFATLLIHVYYSKNIYLRIKKSTSFNFLHIQKIKSNMLFVISLLFLLISFFSIYKSLSNSGDLTNIILSEGAGRDYLEARVNSEWSGVLGLLIWFIPVSITYMFFDYLTELKIKTKRRKRFITIFCLVIAFLGYFLLTVRHNTVSTLLMIFITLMFVKGFSKKQFLFSSLAIIIVLFSFQAIRTGGLNNFTLHDFEISAGNQFDHINSTNLIVNKVNKHGFTFFKHFGDVFVFLVPRKFWPDKPRTSYLNRRFFPDEAKIGTEKSVGIIAEGYTICGGIGVFMLMFFFTILIGLIQIKLDKLFIDLKTFLFILPFIPLTYLGIRTGVIGKHLLSIFIMILQVKLYQIFINSSNGSFR